MGENTGNCPLPQAQGQQTETQIKEEFKKLYQFLREEEEARLSALRDEQKKKQEKIMEKTAEVEGLHTSLSEQIKKIKDDLKHDANLFLHVRILSVVFRCILLIRKESYSYSLFSFFVHRTSEIRRRGKIHYFHTSVLGAKRTRHPCSFLP